MKKVEREVRVGIANEESEENMIERERKNACKQQPVVQGEKEYSKIVMEI